LLTFGVFDDLGASGFHHGDARVGSSEINTDDAEEELDGEK